MNRKFVVPIVLVVMLMLVTVVAIPAGSVVATTEMGYSLVPKPIQPGGMTVDNTPMFKWTKVAGATQYRYQVFQGDSTTPLYVKTLTSPWCNMYFCACEPNILLTSTSYKWQVQAFVGGEWKPFSALKSFYIVVPIPISPTGQITDPTPDMVWSSVETASRYRLQVFKFGVTNVYYTKIVLATNCTELTCTFTLPIELNPAKYRWKVQAFIGEVWRPYSILKYFTVMPE